MEWWLNHVGQMAQLVQDYSLIIHALKPPCCLVCDDLRKIFCKINLIKAKKEIGTMYFVPEESRAKAVHPRQNGSLFR